MKNYSIMLIILACLINHPFTLAQEGKKESFFKVYQDCKVLSSELEKKDFQIIHYDIDILNANSFEAVKENLFKGYGYAIVLYGDPDNISELSLDLSKNNVGNWQFVKAGEPFENSSNVQFMTYNPSLTSEHLLKISPKNFSNPDIKAGRYCLIIGNKKNSIELSAYEKADIKYNVKRKKYSETNHVLYQGEFSIDPVNKTIEHTSQNIPVSSYTIVENNTDPNDPKIVIYNIQDEYGKTFWFFLNSTDATIMLLQTTDNINIYTGQVYFIKLPSSGN